MQKASKVGRSYNKRKGNNVPELLEDRKELAITENKQSDGIHIDQTANESEMQSDIKAESNEFPKELLTVKPKNENENTQFQPEIIDTNSKIDLTYNGVWLNNSQEDVRIYFKST